MAARLSIGGRMYPLDRPSEPPETFAEEDAKDVSKLARVVMRLLKDVATLKRRWWPDRIDFEDRPVDGTGTTKYRFEHGFGGRVRWWVVDWQSTAVPPAPVLTRHDDTDGNTLVLVSHYAGTVTLRVEAAG